MINRNVFFHNIRESLFHVLAQGQVDGIDMIINEWGYNSSNKDLRWLAYVLATAYHETAHTMQPIEEYGHGRGRPYGIPDSNGLTYYGRGFCQLTWKENYSTASNLCGKDLVKYPDLALDKHVAAQIIIQGMEQGVFTGKKLADYFNDHTDDPIGARHIINGNDRAELVASYHRLFLDALTQANEPDSYLTEIKHALGVG